VRPRVFVVAAAAALAYAAFDVAWLAGNWGGDPVTQRFSDLSACACVLFAAVACLVAWRRETGQERKRARRAWGLLFIATTLFALGELTWTTYELLLGREVPFPGIADIGFLGAIPFAALAMLSFPGGPSRVMSSVRTVLDALVVGAAALLIGWATFLAPVYRASEGTLIEKAIGIAYPVSDLVIATIVIVVIVHTGRGARSALALLASGLVALAVADSAFAYLTTVHSYETGGAIDAAWDIGYLLIGLAALRSAPATAVVHTPSAEAPRAMAPPRSRGALVLPYVAVFLVVIVAAVRNVQTGIVEPVLFWGALAIVVLAVIRQLLTLVENQDLARYLEAEVAEREELILQAFHDPLTGLANRTLFHDRAHHALERVARSGKPVSVLYCDLDNLKEVNDTFGHDAGDKLLHAVAERFGGCVRKADTVARLGGDEFAILLEGGADEHVAMRLAERLSGSLRVPFEIDGHEISAGASIGIAVGSSNDAVDDLLKKADIAMYHAKHNGKGRYEIFRPGMRRLREIRAEGADPAV
jgi:diguanylate cyclase (GGDEF)-like protein